MVLAAWAIVGCSLAGSTGEVIAIENAKLGLAEDAAANATVILRDGRIVAIGPELAAPAGAKRIDASGLVLLPGFIDAFSEFGLAPAPEQDGRAGNEGAAQDYGVAAYAETAEASRRGLTPELRARDRLAPADAAASSKLRQAGFTAVLTAPTEGYLPGQACLIELSDTAARSAVVGEPGILVARFRRGGGGRGRGPGGGGGGGDTGYPSTLMGALAHLRQAFADAQHLREWRAAHERAPSAVPRPPDDAALDTILRALDGELRVAFAVDSDNDIRRALAFASEFGLSAIVVGGREAWKCAADLAAAGVPVLASLNLEDEPERKGAKRKKPEPKEPEPKDAEQKEPEPEQPPEAPADPPAPEAAAVPQADAGSGPSAPVEEARVEEWQVEDPVLAEPLELFEQRKSRWVDDVENVERLLDAGVTVALTMQGSASPNDFFADLRVAIEHGLSPQAALDCLTATPARLFHAGTQCGALEVGAAANLILVEGGLADKERAVRHVFVGGAHHPGAKKKEQEKGAEDEAAGRGRRRGERAADAPALDLAGKWVLSGFGRGSDSTLTLAQDGAKLSGSLESEMGRAEVTSGELDGDQFSLTITAEFQGQKFEFKLKGTATAERLSGTFESPFGEPRDFEATRKPGASRMEGSR